LQDQPTRGTIVLGMVAIDEWRRAGRRFFSPACPMHTTTMPARWHAWLRHVGAVGVTVRTIAAPCGGFARAYTLVVGHKADDPSTACRPQPVEFAD
jgi:hypothetical protein